MTDVDPLAIIEAAIPVAADDGCTVIGAVRYTWNRGPGRSVDGTAGNYPPDPGEYQNPLWGHPSTVAALVRDALDKAGLLLTDERVRAIVAEASHGAICWESAGGDRWGLACDRIVGHGGRHSWESDGYQDGWNDCAEDIGNDIEALCESAPSVDQGVVLARAVRIARDHVNLAVTQAQLDAFHNANCVAPGSCCTCPEGGSDG